MNTIYSASTSPRPVHPAAAKGLPVFKQLDPVIGSRTIEVKSSWRPSPILARRPALDSPRSSGSRSDIGEPAPRPEALPVRTTNTLPSQSSTTPVRPGLQSRLPLHIAQNPRSTQKPVVIPSRIPTRSFSPYSRHEIAPDRVRSIIENRYLPLLEGTSTATLQSAAVRRVVSDATYSRSEIALNKVRSMIKERSIELTEDTSPPTPQSTAVRRAVAAFEAKNQEPSSPKTSDSPSISSVSTSILFPQEQPTTTMDHTPFIQPLSQGHQLSEIMNQAIPIAFSEHLEHQPVGINVSVDPASPDKLTPEEERIRRHMNNLNDLFLARAAMDHIWEDESGLMVDKLIVFKPIFPYLAKNMCPIILEMEMLHWAYICVHDDGFDPQVVCQLYVSSTQTPLNNFQLSANANI